MSIKAIVNILYIVKQHNFHYKNVPQQLETDHLSYKVS